MAEVPKHIKQIMGKLLDSGWDFHRISKEEQTEYYLYVCESQGLDPATQPFSYLELNKPKDGGPGKLTLYATRAATDQLRTKRDVSIVEMVGDVSVPGIYIVRVKAQVGDRTDFATGAGTITWKDGNPFAGEALANAIMRAETKAKRRVTLSICGLGMLDESEIESIPGAQPMGAPAPAGGGTKADEVAAKLGAREEEVRVNPETGEVHPQEVPPQGEDEAERARQAGAQKADAQRAARQKFGGGGSRPSADDEAEFDRMRGQGKAARR